MTTKRSLRSLFWTAGIVMILLSSTTTGALAQGADNALPARTGGNVLPPNARPHGYSLEAAAAATAYFNAGPRTPDTLPEDFPFQILYLTPDNSNTFSVKAGTMFYVPVVVSTDTDRALWPYPDVTDPVAVANYYFDPAQLGAEFIRIVVDETNVSELGPQYAAGAVTPGLPLPIGGDNYTVVAGFLTPLSKGVHTVTIAARFSGAFLAPYPDFFPGGVYEFVYSFRGEVE